MTRILIVGGFGALGYVLLRTLRLVDINNQYEITCLPERFDDKFEFDIEVEKNGFYDFIHSFVNHNHAIRDADIIIYLAEINIPSQSSYSLHHNVSVAAQELEFAASVGKRVIVPCWKEFDSRNTVPIDPWTASMIWRCDVANMFHRANAVINTVMLPRIINPLGHEKTFGNLVKRFYESVITASPANIVTGELDDSAEWIWVGAAVEVIISEMKRRTRNRNVVPGTKASTQKIAEYIAWKMGVEYIEVAEQKDSECRRAYATTPQENHLPVTIVAAINNCIEVWDAGQE